ncbi:MAG TPA: hypothetical protein VK157_02685 [Phycisphaerales bacterium]|nr:hypothetical protein [Phycisphaerales bacterium]
MSTPEFPSSDLPGASLDAARSERIARYVDGMLSDVERVAFEAEMLRDGELAREVQAQREADVGLRMLFDPAQAAEVSLDEVAETPLGWWRRGWVRFAAAIVLLGLTWLIVEPFVWPNPLAVAYARERSENFKPYAVCTTPEEFQSWTRAALGEPLATTEVPADIELVGWDYAPEVAGYTSVLIAKIDDRRGGPPHDQHVLVMMDRADRARRVSHRLMGDLHVFEATIGEVRLTEVSPYEVPLVLPLLRKAGCEKSKAGG